MRIIQIIYVLFGLPGTGKSISLVDEVNKRKANKNYIFYSHLREYCRRNNEDQKYVVGLINNMPELNQIIRWLRKSYFFDGIFKRKFL
jgi:hypothetical protein